MHYSDFRRNEPVFMYAQNTVIMSPSGESKWPFLNPSLGVYISEGTFCKAALQSSGDGFQSAPFGFKVEYTVAYIFSTIREKWELSVGENGCVKTSRLVCTYQMERLLKLCLEVPDEELMTHYLDCKSEKLLSIYSQHSMKIEPFLDVKMSVSKPSALYAHST